MHWTIAAPWINESNLGDTKWIHDFIVGNDHEFSLIPRPEPIEDWHGQKSEFTSRREWKIHWQHSKIAINQTRGGLITVFPQLAATAGIQKRLGRKSFPILAYLFNVGYVPGGIKKLVARHALSSVDRFVVHTTRERELYSEWLKLPIDRFQFLPLQGGKVEIVEEEDTENPFILAMGSAHRDYDNFFKAMQRLQLRTIVIAAPRVLEGLDIPENVEVKSGLTMQECFAYTQRARLNITPLLPKENVTATGQVTIVNTMNMGKMLVSSDCNGVDDYISHDETGWLIKPNSAAAIAESIDLLWNDHELRNRLNSGARSYAEQHFSDESAGRNLAKILDELAADYS